MTATQDDLAGVSLRFAREEYARGYALGKGRHDSKWVDDFARLYGKRCSRNGAPVSVEDTYDEYVRDRADLAHERLVVEAADYATNFEPENEWAGE